MFLIINPLCATCLHVLIFEIIKKCFKGTEQHFLSGVYRSNNFLIRGSTAM